MTNSKKPTTHLNTAAATPNVASTPQTVQAATTADTTKPVTSRAENATSTKPKIPTTNASVSSISSMPIKSATLVPAADVRTLTLAPPMQDVRGWDVTGPGAASLGTVDHILLDRAEGKPRYLTVLLPEARGRLLLPIGVATADTKAKQVMLDDMKPEVLKALPTLTEELITPEFEQTVVRAVTGDKEATYTPSRWYHHPAFDPAQLFASPSP